jgi:putative heme-binding domain-containing protein
VNWNSGNSQRGQSIFVERGCQTCHAITSSLGPELGGVASRFSADDLFKAIIYPSRDISPLYRPTVFRMRNGETYIGIISFESADGVIVTTSANTNVRLASSEMVSRELGKVSLMPTGLLSGLPPQALADLHAYLKTLGSASH